MTPDEFVEWLQKRSEKLKGKKKAEAAKMPLDLYAIQRIGAKISAYREVLQYINTH
jgi:hypothetical protein